MFRPRKKFLVFIMKSLKNQGVSLPTHLFLADDEGGFACGRKAFGPSGMKEYMAVF